jgi:proline-specific peptidase
VGEGPILVAHPGGPGFSARYFDGDLGGLARDFTLILLDPRGTGASDTPGESSAYTTDDYVADVEELRLHLGEEQLNLLGHSHGGVVAAAYAAAYPQRIRRLVIANSLVRVRPEAMEAAMLERADEPWYDDARAALEEEEAAGYDNPDELAALALRMFPMYFAKYDDEGRAYLQRSIDGEHPNPDALKLFNTGIESWDMRPELEKIDAPTLVITGARDFICGPACADDFAEHIAGAERVVIEDCGHFTFVEQPERWRAEISRFVA